MKERSGLDRFLDLNDTYDVYGAKTLFRLITKNATEKCVKSGKWFSFCTKASEEQLDILSVKNSEGIKIGSFVSSIYSESPYRTGVYKSLLRDYLCYYETPATSKSNGNYKYSYSYNKFLATSNLYVVAIWLDITLEEANELYGYILGDACEDSGCDFFPYVKLYISKTGERKITKPRREIDLSLSGTRIVPVYALKAGMDILYGIVKNDTYDITFIKDSGQVRTVNTTFSLDIIRSIYKDESIFTEPYYNSYNGNFLENPNISNGYIRIFEVGGSIYDSLTRSINFARIINFEKSKPNLAFINIDINSALEEFKEKIVYLNENTVSDVVNMLDIYDVGVSRELAGTRISSVQELENWANEMSILLNTVFLRELSLFMLGNPQWFSGYTGKPKYEYSSTLEGTIKNTLQGVSNFNEIPLEEEGFS